MPKEKYPSRAKESSTALTERPLPPRSKPLESSKVFPVDEKSAYLSSYFQDSYKFPYNPDPLVGSNTYSIYDEMKHDDQIKAVISFKKDLINSSGWQIKCDNQEIVDFIESNLKEKLETPFEDNIRDILSAFEYGFSMTEVVYRLVDGKYEIRSLKTRPPHTFEFHLDKLGNVEKIIQNAENENKEFPPDFFLHHVYQPEFGNPYGQSDFRSAHQPWKTKKFFLRFWAIYVERFAAPTVVGSYPDEFDENKISRLQAILQKIQNSTTMTVPQGTMIDFKMPQRDSSDIYEKGVNMFNVMIARSILMPDLLGISGDKTSGGSYSLGQTQFQMFMGMIRKEQDALARKITMKILRPLVLANWGDYPVEFEFKPFTQENSVEFMRIWLDAVKGHLWVPTDEEINHLRESVKFPVGTIERPEPVEIDPSTGKPVPKAKSLGNDGGKQNEGKKENQNGKEQEPDNAGAREAGRKMGMRMDVLNFREFTRFEKKVDFASIKKSFSGGEESAMKRLLPFANDILSDLLNQIREKQALSKFKPDAINDLTPRFQRPMNSELKGMMKSLYRSSYTQAQKEIFPMSEATFAIDEERLPEEFLEIVEADAFKMVGDYSIHITKKLKDRLMEGIKAGVNERDLSKALRELGEEETQRWLRTVIRTKATEMFNHGRKAYYETDEVAKQIVEAYQFSAIMDDRTSDVCSSLDGKIFDKGEFTSSVVPPLHFNCRSIWVPITKFEDYESSKPPSIESLKSKGGNLLP